MDTTIQDMTPGRDARALRLSRHAAKRMQQRGLALDAVAAVLDYGREVRSRGASLYYLDRQARARIASELGHEKASRLRDHLNILVVAGEEGRIVTASHRTSRVRRDVAIRLH